jgi:hypothetical protein
VDLLHDFEEHRLVLLHAAGLEPEPALELALQLAHAQRLVVLLVEHELDLRLDLRARRHGEIALREEFPCRQEVQEECGSRGVERRERRSSARV